MIFTNKRHIVGLSAIALLALGVLGLSLLWLSPGGRQNWQPDGVRTTLIDQQTLSALAKTEVPIDRTHLKDGMTPPTNKWFSGFALQKQPEPGYSYPNSFLPHPNGFEFSLPKIIADKTIITGPHTPAVVVTIHSAVTYNITDYDELTVALTYYDARGDSVATVRVASGLPYIYVTAARDNAVISFNGSTSLEQGWTQITAGDTFYGASMEADKNQLSLSKSSSAVFFSAPSQEALAQVATYAGSIVVSGRVSYERRDDSFKTTFHYATENNKPVLFARLPHQQTHSGPSHVTYRSILGDLSTEVGTEFSFTTPIVPVKDQLDLSGITGDKRGLLVRQLKIDIAAFDDKKDTYFAGKQLYRMAQLLVIAEQLNEQELAKTARVTLRRELDAWLRPGKDEPKSFLYDAAMRGIVGNEASFGSDKEFNDHHFHYGYFIYAAAILAQYDHDFLATHKNMVNILVADIANYNTDERLPLRRSFDPYFGHSWASGTAPFKDGNNQESTSEAINAWIAVSLWGRQTQNKALEREADWMLSQEYRTAQTYWLLQQPLPDYLRSYGSPIASIVWGGKREYATFFSDEANAKLAIQLLPLSPTIKRLDRSLADAVLKSTSTEKAYGDYILMAHQNATIDEAVALPDSSIDDGNSRAYIYAYIMSR